MGPPGESDGTFPWLKLFTIHRIRQNGPADGQYIKNEKSFRSMYPQRPQFSHSLTDHCPSDHRTKKQAGTSSVSACLNHLSSKTVSGPGLLSPPNGVRAPAFCHTSAAYSSSFFLAAGLMFLGTAMRISTNSSPFLGDLPSVWMPFSLRRILAPDWIPAGILQLTLP